MNLTTHQVKHKTRAGGCVRTINQTFDATPLHLNCSLLSFVVIFKTIASRSIYDRHLFELNLNCQAWDKQFADCEQRSGVGRLSPLPPIVIQEFTARLNHSGVVFETGIRMLFAFTKLECSHRCTGHQLPHRSRNMVCFDSVQIFHIQRYQPLLFMFSCF